jgi:hypothetical protein
VTHAGSTKKFSAGWEAIFGKTTNGGKSAKKSKTAGTKSSPKKRPATAKPARKKIKR